MNRLARILDASDPGQVRLRGASATTLTVLLAMVTLVLITRAIGQPVTVAMLGTVVAMQASAAVKDKDQHSRLVTTALMALPASAAVTLAALLSELGKVADVGFIAVLFTAVWVRRFGPRGTALGMVSFISYFFALFLRATPGQLPMLIAAILGGLVIALFVRAVIFPDRPIVEVRRLLFAMRAVSVSVLEAASAGESRDLNLVRRRLDRLGNTALMIDDWLDRHDAGQLLSVTSTDLSLRVFDAQIATEQLVSSLWALDPAKPWPTSLGQATTALGSVLQNTPSAEQLRAARRLASTAAERADPSTLAGIATVSAQRAVQAHIAIHHITTNAVSVSATAAVEPSEAAVKDTPSGLDPSTKAAIQVAVATSAATVLGELVSPDRWYWAVLTAFLVFTGASTRGEILTRASQRVLGTIAGVLAGVVIAALVGNNQPLQLVLIVVCVFFAFYLVTVAYALLSFFVTILLAMLYGLLGTFSIEVLELRIVETAVGGVVGMVSAYFIFSTSTRKTLVDRVDTYLEQLDALIESSVESVIAPGEGTDLVASTRTLDNALKDVVTAGKPLVLGPTTRSRRGAKRLLRVLAVSGRSAHALARAGVLASRADAGTAPTAETAQALRDAAALVRDTVGHVEAAVAGNHVEPPEKITETTVLDVLLTSTNAPGPLRGAVRALNTMNRTLADVLTRG
ncbi:FUSC family protein [Rhodococcus sp. IEGM 1401]|uniref:FUSC family protein n=1 Tax=unclassified Rhodococcus (in: high G+C Gram-positive bacteria) TaxID=192944 RepID=UPI0022B2E4AF|nr:MULTISPECIES: FUSC family protein [unclassified Rhodococcus (in: high G+C Gram-positive bacteria)]MCZ4563897.1 FUSC family protein [Rhodococcus sp. IEGM 1401]MDI9924004.1 FUSC family protein [Rhodococcus sp. IEGM 1372]MDV8036486.1 FUSC family protein [Rhodococcus sp. IEGM 1414]